MWGWQICGFLVVDEVGWLVGKVETGENFSETKGTEYKHKYKYRYKIQTWKMKWDC